MNCFITLQQYLNLPEFVTGLVFFVMGFVILLQFWQYRHLSDLKLVRSIWLLAVFGIFQGLALWMGTISPLSLAPHFPPHLDFWFNLWEVILNTISFFFLYFFATELMIQTLGKDYYLKLTIFFLTALWLIIFLLTYSTNWQTWLEISLTWARFLLAFPGSILAGLALTFEAKEFRNIGMPKLTLNLYGVIASFCLYALASGLTIPNTPVFTIITSFSSTALNDILRTISGLGMASFIIRIMEIFNIENNKKLAAARQREVVLQERLRISRDLHDGIIQSLYGIGLSLEMVVNSPGSLPPKTKDLLVNTLDRLDTTITDIRYYILDLTLPEDKSLKWPDSLMTLVENFTTSSPVNIELFIIPSGEPPALDLHLSQELNHVIREALTNITRHAQAENVSLAIQHQQSLLQIQISDDGQGFCPGITPTDRLAGNGLKNMQERIKKLGGDFQLSSQLSKGTIIKISLPLERVS